MSSSSALKLAATVVLLRDAPGGLEAYLVRRGSRAAFMPDLHVYPGGRVDESDDALVETLRWDGSAVPPNGHGPASLVAAIRELLEEAGVMLVQGTLPPLDAREQARTALNAGQRSFAAVLAEAGLVADATSLVAFDHWITPEFESRRYDTVFYLAPMPSGQTASEDAAEVYDGAWWSPAVLLAAYRTRAVSLAPPTFATLDWLSQFGSVAAALGAAAVRAVVPILPVLAPDAALPTLLLPGDARHPSPTPCAPPHQLVCVEGCWQWGSP